jgi:hypothetical protein
MADEAIGSLAVAADKVGGRQNCFFVVGRQGIGRSLFSAADLFVTGLVHASVQPLMHDQPQPTCDYNNAEHHVTEPRSSLHDRISSTTRVKRGENACPLRFIYVH